jgi:hypothetical protein
MASETSVTSETNTIRVEGYKIFQSDWSCLGYPYQVGKTHEFEGEIQMEKAGLHFCSRALDCIRYYKPDPRFKYAKVRGSDQIITIGDKSVTNRLQIIKELSHKEFMQLCTGRLKTTRCQTTYQNGIKKGEYIEWHNNGTMILKCQYDNNKLHGLAEEWNQHGIRISYKFYARGNLIHQFIPFLDGKIKIKRGNFDYWVCQRIPNLNAIGGHIFNECDERQLRLYCDELLKSY